MIAVRKSSRELTAMRRPWPEAFSLSRPSRGMGTPLTCRKAGRIIKGTGGFQKVLPCRQHAMALASCCFHLPIFSKHGSHPALALPRLAVRLWQPREGEAGLRPELLLHQAAPREAIQGIEFKAHSSRPLLCSGAATVAWHGELAQSGRGLADSKSTTVRANHHQRKQHAD